MTCFQTHKICTSCTIEKELSDFHNHKKGKLGKAERCRVCTSEYNRMYRQNNKRAIQSSKLQLNFGISYSEYEQMWETQHGKCLICGEYKDKDGYANHRLHVDHCHITGKVRGLLCHMCNRALGLFKDDWQIMSNALDYLERNSFE